MQTLLYFVAAAIVHLNSLCVLKGSTWGWSGFISSYPTMSCGCGRTTRYIAPHRTERTELKVDFWSVIITQGCNSHLIWLQLHSQPAVPLTRKRRYCESWLLPLPRRLCFHQGLFVSEQDWAKNTQPISMKLCWGVGHEPRKCPFNSIRIQDLQFCADTNKNMHLVVSKEEGHSSLMCYHQV